MGLAEEPALPVRNPQMTQRLELLERVEALADDASARSLGDVLERSQQILARRGERVQAWQKSASVSFLKPASTRLTLEFSLSDEDVARACGALEKDGRYVHTYRTEAVDLDGRVCAIVDSEIYLRKPRTGQKEVHAI